MTRTTTASRTLEELLDQAERDNRCLGTNDPSALKALRRRTHSAERTPPSPLCPPDAAKEAPDPSAIIEPYPRLFARAATWSRLNRGEQALRIMRTLSRMHPTWVFCRFSAALAHGLSVSYRLIQRPSILTDPHTPTRGTPYLERCPATCSQPVESNGVRVTPLLETVTDCLLRAPFAEGLACADAVLRTEDMERGLLEEEICRLGRGRPGIKRALATVAWADGRAENGGESIARAAMIDAGLAPTDLQTTFADPTDSHHVMRPDFVHLLRNGTLVASELDGMEKYQNRDMLAGKTTTQAVLDERKRESRLSMLGIVVVRFEMADVWRPGEVPRLLAAAGVSKETLAPMDYRDTARTAAVRESGGGAGTGADSGADSGAARRVA